MNNKTALGRFRNELKNLIGESTKIEITDTFAIGPFENIGFMGLLNNYSVEANQDINLQHEGKNGTVNWVEIPVYNGFHNEYMDVSPFIPYQPWSVIYVMATINVKDAQIAELSLECAGIGFAWLNGEKILEPRIPRQCNFLEDTFFVSLRKGSNKLLFKLHIGEDPWVFKWMCNDFGNTHEVIKKVSNLKKNKDVIISLNGKYTLADIYGSLNDEVEMNNILNEIKNDDIATKWDKIWVDNVLQQKEDTNSYLPLRDIFFEYEPEEDTNPCKTIWPKVKEIDNVIDVLDLNDETASVEFAYKVLQGLVNRIDPSLYIIHREGDDRFEYKSQDLKWVKELNFQGYKTSNISKDDAWNKYKSFVKGAVIYDGSIMDEIGDYYSHMLNQTHVVMMISSLNNAIPITAEMNEKLQLPIIFDARNKWNSQFEMMNFAYRELYPKMNHSILATMYPGKFYLTDYLVAFNIFTFWFPHYRTVAEENLLNGILASTPPNTPILGWWFDWMPTPNDENQRKADALKEEPGLLHGSYFGKMLTPTHEATNLTIHSGTKLLEYKHKKIEEVEYNNTKIYYSYVISDGDNLGEALMIRTRDLHWDKQERGIVPVGWTIAPASSIMAPTVLNYYMRTLTKNDLIMNGLGAGYTEPTIYLRAFGDKREQLFNEYGKITEQTTKALDTNCLWLINGLEQDINYYAKNTNTIEGIFVGYGASPEMASVTTISNNVQMIRPATINLEGVEKDRQGYIDQMVNDIEKAAENGQQFIEAWVLNWAYSMDMLVEVDKRLGNKFISVRPDQLLNLIKISKGINKY